MCAMKADIEQNDFDRHDHLHDDPIPSTGGGNRLLIGGIVAGLLLVLGGVVIFAVQSPRKEPASTLNRIQTREGEDFLRHLAEHVGAYVITHTDQEFDPEAFEEYYQIPQKLTFYDKSTLKYSITTPLTDGATIIMLPAEESEASPLRAQYCRKLGYWGRESEYWVIVPVKVSAICEE